ncbi:hypothetical protein HPULCUR_006802 [Helicostylum pulchrum]|uniref:Uncharacterized protein n=1 Tax=Helicostylum pulchrum TaxID=562976 RepID=A0ABP9Y333_9FUNG
MEGDRENKCMGKFCDSGDNDEFDDKYFATSNTCDGTLSATFDPKGNDFRGPDLDLDLPDKTSSMIGPEIFSCLKLKLVGGNRGMARGAINYALLQCPDLLSFDFKCYGLLYEEVFSYIRYKRQDNLISSDPTHQYVRTGTH